mgnify:CR=1 FL=1
MGNKYIDGLFSWHTIGKKEQQTSADPLISARQSDPVTSKTAATKNKGKRQTYKDRLLLVFDEALPVFHSGRLGDVALNAFEVSAIAKLPPTSCWWKRVSDLKEERSIQVIGTRVDPRTNSQREAYIITDEGRRRAKEIRERK